MSEITGLIAREILDSRGNPTVEVEVQLETGATGRAAVPSGASTGTREALELRDTQNSRYGGKGVLQAVKNVNEHIAPTLLGFESSQQVVIDNTMLALDNTVNKEKLGANAILGVSMAVAKATAMELELPLYNYLGGVNAKILPVPMMNILNGGAHADNNVDIQEFMILPAGAQSFSEALRMGAETFHALKAVLKKRGLQTAGGDEGGFAPNLRSNEEAMEAILEGIVHAGYSPGKDIFIGIDAAASEFYSAKEQVYVLGAEKKPKKTAEQMIAFYTDWVNKYPLITIEDGLDESDWDGWKLLTNALGKRIQLVGDDIFVTNTRILKKGIAQNIANSILIKLNQIGSVTETIDAVAMAHRASYTAPLWRNGRYNHRRFGGRAKYRADQNRRSVTKRQGCKIQPVTADRGRIRGGSPVCRDNCISVSLVNKVDKQLYFPII